MCILPDANLFLAQIARSSSRMLSTALYHQGSRVAPVCLSFDEIIAPSKQPNAFASWAGSTDEERVDNPPGSIRQVPTWYELTFYPDITRSSF